MLLLQFRINLRCARPQWGPTLSLSGYRNVKACRTVHGVGSSLLLLTIPLCGEPCGETDAIQKDSNVSIAAQLGTNNKFVGCSYNFEAVNQNLTILAVQ